MRLDAAHRAWKSGAESLAPVAAVKPDATVLMPSTLEAVRRGGPSSAAQGRMGADVVGTMRDAGLFRLLQPRRYGGGEVLPHQFFAAQAELARTDMSAGWLLGVMGVLSFHLALFSELAQDEVWLTNPDALMASSYMQTGRATPSDGGYILSGSWHFASGADHADWFMLGATAALENGTTDRFVALVPRAEATIRQEWNATGLQATGSQGVTVSGTFVPQHRVHGIRERFEGLSPGFMVNTAPLYRVPLPQMLFRVISTPAVGALHGMLDAVLAHNAARMGVTGVAASNDPVIQLTVGEAAALIDELTVVLRSSLDRLMAYAHGHQQASLKERMIYRLQATTVVDRCCRMAARLFQATGTSGLCASKPFGRYLADIQAARQHAANQFEGHGRALGAALLGSTDEDTLL
jgi:3-hydroxy-9,10-secoandrosta-1,3,5(10)-triene-9,17-dione monooxygenase